MLQSLQLNNLLAIGGLILATRMWFDICDLLKQHIKMNSYVKLSSCALDILKILQEESKSRKKLMCS